MLNAAHQARCWWQVATSYCSDLIQRFRWHLLLDSTRLLHRCMPITAAAAAARLSVRTRAQALLNAKSMCSILRCSHRSFIHHGRSRHCGVPPTKATRWSHRTSTHHVTDHHHHDDAQQFEYQCVFTTDQPPTTAIKIASIHRVVD
jgi:hypothetical protein